MFFFFLRKISLLHLSLQPTPGRSTHNGIIDLYKSHAVASVRVVAASRLTTIPILIPHPLFVKIRRFQVRPLQWSHAFRTMSLLNTFVKKFGLTPNNGKLSSTTPPGCCIRRCRRDVWQTNVATFDFQSVCYCSVSPCVRIGMVFRYLFEAQRLEKGCEKVESWPFGDCRRGLNTILYSAEQVPRRSRSA